MPRTTLLQAPRLAKLALVAASAVAGLLFASALPRALARTGERSPEPAPAVRPAVPPAAGSETLAAADLARLAAIEARLAAIEASAAALEAAVGEVRVLRKESETLLSFARNAALELERGQLGVRKEADHASTRIGEQCQAQLAELRAEGAKERQALAAEAERLKAVAAEVQRIRAALRADLEALLTKLGA